jgi:hypothetical protein
MVTSKLSTVQYCTVLQTTLFIVFALRDVLSFYPVGCVTVALPSIESRIVGGNEAEKGKYPYYGTSTRLDSTRMLFFSLSTVREKEGRERERESREIIERIHSVARNYR